MKELGRKPCITLRELAKELVAEDLKAAEKDALMKEHG